VLRADVTQIRTRGGTVLGVDTRGEGPFDAPRVIAAVHPSIALDLVGETAVRGRFVRRIRALRDTPSALLVHVVARGLPMPERRRNRFWFASAEQGWREERKWFAEGELPPAMAVLAGPPADELPGDSVFHALCPLRARDIEESLDRAALRSRQAAFAQRLLPTLETCIPGSRGRLEVLDVSGPHAFRHFVRSPGGSCYGAECSVGQERSGSLGLRLGIDGLALAGQSVGLPGVLGCMASATAAAFPAPAELADIYAELREDREPD